MGIKDEGIIKVSTNVMRKAKHLKVVKADDD